jgi:hypothetical protein
MPLRDVCDAAYALMVEKVERRSLALIAAGVDVDPDEAREELDASLLQPLTVSSADREREELMRAVGLRR